MKTTANVYLLPTNNTTNLLKENGFLVKYNHNPFFRRQIGDEFQNLYIALSQSDLEISKIKEDSFYYNYRLNKVYQAKRKNYEINYNIVDKKEVVIATTDKLICGIKHLPWGKELESKYDYEKGYPQEIYLPSIPKSFVEYYISEFNQGNIIHQIDIELEEYGTVMKDFKDINYRLKLNRQNEIILYKNL
jgi:hypothetical protein